MGGVEKNQETFTVFLSKEVVQGILLLCRLSVIFCYKNEKSHQKGAFWPAHNGYYCFLRSIYICFDDLFMKRFILGYVVINAHVMNWKKLLQIEWRLMKNLVKSQKQRNKKAPSEIFEPIVMYCISLTGYGSKCFLKPSQVKIVSKCTFLVFKEPWAVKLCTYSF